VDPMCGHVRERRSKPWGAMSEGEGGWTVEDDPAGSGEKRGRGEGDHGW
jgi:hypothetical protein